MSNTIDSKVVEMKFDNRNFETNVKESMSTIDKLKAKLKFKGAEEGFKAIDKASDNCNFKTMSSSLDTLTHQFSAWETIAFSALNRVTNQAMAAGEKILKALTIDNVSAGYSKYEQKTSYVQTLMNSTGMSLSEVDTYLEKLMWFSDETSFSFTEMTSSLATLMASGADIDKMIPMITGMANATAYAGKSGAEFSRVIYNLSQSYSQGYLNLLDWKSVALAGVNSKALIDELIKAGEELGTIAVGEITQANFTSTLSDKWATTEVMEKAFGVFASASEEARRLVEEEENGIDTATQAYKYMETLDEWKGSLALKAAQSAQAATSWSQVVAATQDAVSSKFMTMFETVLGNYEEVKELMSSLAESFYDIFAAPLDSVSDALYDAFKSPYDDLKKLLTQSEISIDDFNEKVGEAYEKAFGKEAYDELLAEYDLSIEKAMKNGAISTEIFQEALTNTSGKVEDTTELLSTYNNLIKRIWAGDFGNGTTRANKLTAAGYDAALVQSMLNRAWHQGKTSISEFTDAELEALGVNRNYIENLEEFMASDSEFSSIIDDLSNGVWSGRDLFTNAIYNIVESIRSFLTYFRQIKSEVFEGINGSVIYNWLNAVWELTEKFKMEFEDEDDIIPNDRLALVGKLLKGIMLTIKSIADIVKKSVTPIIKGVLNIAEDLASILFNMLTFVFSTLGDIADWIRKNEVISTIIEAITAAVMGIYTALKTVISYVVTSPLAKGIYEDLKLLFTMMGDYLGNKIPEWRQNIQDFIQALNDNGFTKLITDFLDGMGQSIDKKFKDLKKNLGTFYEGAVKSLADGFTFSTIPSLIGSFATQVIAPLFDVYYEAENVKAVIDQVFTMGNDALDKVGGDLKNLKDNALQVYNALKGFIDGIDWNTLIAFAMTLTNAIIAKQAIDAIGWLDKAINGVGEILGSIRGVFSAAISFIKKSQLLIVGAFLIELSIALGILAYAYGKINEVVTDSISKDQIDKAVLIGTAMLIGVVIFGLLAKELAKIAEAGGENGFNSPYTAVAAMMLSIAILIGVVAWALAKVNKAELSPKSILPIFGLIALVGGVMWAAIQITKEMNKMNTDQSSWKKYAGFIVVLAAFVLAIKVLVNTVNKASKIKNAGQGLLTLVIVAVIIGVLGYLASKLTTIQAFTIKMASQAILMFSGALYIIVLAIDKMSKIKIDDISSFILSLAGVIGTIWALAEFSGLGGAGLVETITGFCLAFMALAIAIKLIGSMSWGQIGKAAIVLIGLLAFIGILMFVMKKLSVLGTDTSISLKNETSWATQLATFIGIAIVIAALAASLVALSLVEPGKLITAALAMMGVMYVATYMLKAVTKSADKSKSVIAAATIWALASMISAMAAAIVLLGKQDTGTLIKGTAVMAVLMIGVTAMLKSLSFVSSAAKKVKVSSALAIMGILAVIGLIAGLITKMVLDKVKGMSEAQAKTACTILAVIFAGMTAVLLAVAYISKASVLANPASFVNVITVLGYVLAALVVAGVAIWGAIEFFQWLGDRVDLAKIQKGLDAAEKVFIGIGSMIGGFVGGIVGGLVAGLVGGAAAALAWIGTLGDKFEEIGDHLDKFTTGSKSFIELANGIGSSKDTTKGIDSIVELLKAITGMDEQIKAVSTVNFTEDGGLLETLENYSECIKVFAGTLAEGDENLSKIDAAVTIAAKMAEMYKNLADHGNKELDPEFLNNLRNVAQGLLSLARDLTTEYRDGNGELNKVLTLTDDQKKNMENFMYATDQLLGLYDKLPENAGLSKVWSSKDAAALANSIKAFVETLRPVAEETGRAYYKPAKFDLYIEVVQSLISVATSLQSYKAGTINVQTFANNLGLLGEQIKEFGTKVSGTDLEAVKVGADALGIIFSELSKYFTGQEGEGSNMLENFPQELSKLADSGIKSFSDSFSSEANLKLITSAGDAFFKALKTAFKEKQADVKDALNTAFDKADNYTNKNTLKTRFYDIGVYVGEGLVEGINSKEVAIVQAITKVMTSLVQGAEVTVKINSPSKVFAGIGEYLDLGLIEGIRNRQQETVDAASDLASNVTDGFTNTISSMALLIENGLDANPTITPVLDLSQIQNGTSAINGMLNNSYSLAARSGYGLNNTNSNQQFNGGNSSTIVNMTINGSEGQNVDELAAKIQAKLSRGIARKGAIWR